MRMSLRRRKVDRMNNKLLQAKQVNEHDAVRRNLKSIVGLRMMWRMGMHMIMRRRKADNRG